MRDQILASCLVLVLSSLGLGAAAAEAPRVTLTTNQGVIGIELYPDRAPATVENFLGYVRAGQYDGTVFHRVIAGFMIQGGGFTPGLKGRPSNAPIKNEADNGLKNAAGTIAMARTSDPHSASNQFFINVADNAFLDHRAKSAEGWGYAVFGKVVEGMEVVRMIERVATRSVGPFDDVPAEDVVIERAKAQ